MDLEMVLNELSLRSPANDIPTAQQWMLDLISTINVGAGHGVKKIIHIDRNLYNVVLAQDYPIARWLNDSQVDKDTRRYFRSLTTKLSFIADLPEFWYQEHRANGLGFAFQHELLAVSLRSKLHWHSSRLKLEIRYLNLMRMTSLSLSKGKLSMPVVVSIYLNTSIGYRSVLPLAFVMDLTFGNVEESYSQPCNFASLLGSNCEYSIPAIPPCVSLKRSCPTWKHVARTGKNEVACSTSDRFLVSAHQKVKQL